MKLDYKDSKSGSSLRSQLEQVWKQTNKKPTELEMPSLSSEAFYLRETFWELWNSEGWSWTELYHYQLIYDIEFNVAEIQILRNVFSACSSWLSEKMKPKDTHPKSKGTK